jgi:dCMP deaminase
MYDYGKYCEELVMNKWDEAHMKVARVYAELSSARRAKVGCIIVKDNRIQSIGYNGMPTGWDNNCEVEIRQHELGTMSLVTKQEVLHAETNAIAKIARSTESCEGSTIYITMQPCIDCAKLIYQSGIARVVWADEYPKGTAGLNFLTDCGILWDRL